MFANIICFIEAPPKRVLSKRKLQEHIDYDHNWSSFSYEGYYI